MARYPETLPDRISARLDTAADPLVAEFAQRLAEQSGANAVLFYGSNLRTGSLEGVLDFYVLLPGEEGSLIWPQVSYHEREADGAALRAKVATMALSTFARAASGELTDTTIWARFVQPSALVFARDTAARGKIVEAISAAAMTAAAATQVVRVEPWTERRDDGTYLCIPTEAGYTVCEELLPERAG